MYTKLMATDEEFWLSIPPKIAPGDIPFEPHCYVTSRSIPVEWTQRWLDQNGYPAMPVISVPFGESKVAALKDAGVTMFVDDHFQNFVDINAAGIPCFLFDTPQNQRHNVGHKRIKSLRDLPGVPS